MLSRTWSIARRRVGLVLGSATVMLGALATPALATIVDSADPYRKAVESASPPPESVAGSSGGPTWLLYVGIGVAVVTVIGRLLVD